MTTMPAKLSALHVVTEQLRDALLALSRANDGSHCWCEMSIGHPSIRQHSSACDQAAYALQQVAAALAGQDEGPEVEPELRLLRRQVERMALCPDHRDKGTGRCIVCQAEERTRNELIEASQSPSTPEGSLSHSMRKRQVATGAVGGSKCGCTMATWCDAHRPEIFGGKAGPTSAGEEP